MERGAREADKKAAEAAITNPLMSKLRKGRREGGRDTNGKFPLLGSLEMQLQEKWKKWKREGERGREGHSTTTKPFFRKLRDWAG